MTKNENIGQILDSETLLLRQHVGEASDDSSNYEMCLSADMSPLIRSEKTGQFYSLSWPDILALAVKNGIDKTQD